LSRVSFIVLIAVLFPTFAFSLDKHISGVAPEYQEAAQKRQAELVRQRFCREKASKEKVTKRDLAPFVLGCMDEVEKVERATNK
jgi:hypothetical protein